MGRNESEVWESIMNSISTQETQQMVKMDFSNARSRAANYINECNNLADDYPCTAHGVQKDGIQNAVDARKGKLPACVEFAFIENDRGTFLTITDWNTKGLTGPVLCKEEYEEFDKLPEEYHWARFESLAFHKESPDSLGARGKGKFILLHASNDYMMFYDTLRDDGVYRLGVTQAKKSDCPMLHWEGEEAKAKLADKCGLNPLFNVGTRIIIVNPKEEVVRYLTEGEFEKAIQETWFRAIEKKRLIVTLRYHGEDRQVGLPEFHPLPEADTKDFRVWLLGNDFVKDEIGLPTGEGFRVKRFHAVYRSSGTFPEPLQGIAVIQNGMKIESSDKTIPPQIARDRLTGFIEFDTPLDHEIRKGENQHPNHYRLNWRSRTCRAIKEYIFEQLEEFGRKKLNLGVDPRQRRKKNQADAEEWAMKELMRIADDLDLFGAKGGRIKKRRKKPIVIPPPGKEFAVSIEGFSFPDPTIQPRVNWGHELGDINIITVSASRGTREVCLRTIVMQGDSVLYQPLGEQRLTLKPTSVKQFGPFSIPIIKEQFHEPGQYRLNAALFDARTGDRLDHSSKTFWVEKDPPFRSPFDRQPYPGPNDHRQWYISGSINRSPVAWYNTSHPAYRDVEEDSDRLKDYNLDIFLQAAIAFILDRPNKEDGSPDFHPLDAQKILGESEDITDLEEIPKNAYVEAMRYLSEIKWRAYGGA
jgi:hypothetical protein